MAARRATRPLASATPAILAQLHSFSSLSQARIYINAPVLADNKVFYGSTTNAGFGKAPGGGGLRHAEAVIASSARIEANAVVHEGARIGENSVIRSCAVIGPGVTVGSNTTVGYGASLEHCVVGDDCIIHSGVRIGADGFGFTVDEGTGKVVKKPQELEAVVGNQVEIGANSCVDRGSWRETIIGDFCKLDNHVQVGHNAQLGKACILCAQTALGGSSTLGDYVVMGGKSAVKDHVSVCSQVRIAAKAGVIADIAEPGDYAGFPAVPAGEWRRQVVEKSRRRRKAAQGGGGGGGGGVTNKPRE